MVKKWKIKPNGTKSMYMTFTKRCQKTISNCLKISEAESVKYLRLRFDRRLNWKKHIFTKRKQEWIPTWQNVLIFDCKS